MQKTQNCTPTVNADIYCRQVDQLLNDAIKPNIYEQLCEKYSFSP